MLENAIALPLAVLALGVVAYFYFRHESRKLDRRFGTGPRRNPGE